VVLTPTHGALASLFALFFKKKWPRWKHLLLFLGATLPDIPVITARMFDGAKYALRELFLGNTLHWYWPDIGSYPSVILSGHYSHSVFVWLAVLAVSSLFAPLRKVFLPLGCGALFFHVLLDWLTHTKALSPAHGYVLPFHNPGIYGPVSHHEPWFIVLEVATWALWVCCLYFFLNRASRASH